MEQKITTLSYTRPELWPIYCLKFEIFVTMVTGSFEQSLTDTIKLAYLENPILRASIWAVCLSQAKLLPILC